jgi:hypothetical protein
MAPDGIGVAEQAAYVGFVCSMIASDGRAAGNSDQVGRKVGKK